MEHEVFISRIHKQSPYNVQAYFIVDNIDREEVIKSDEVRRAMANCKGNNLIIQVISQGYTSFLKYEMMIKRHRTA